MNGFLLDTNVLSEFSRSAVAPDPRVKDWISSAAPSSLFVSVLSVGEIRKGIDLLPTSKKRTQLEQWLEADLNGWFGNNLLPVTKGIAERWGRLTAAARQQGQPLGTIDGLLAATAYEHGLTVATRNAKHFAGLGVEIFDPWSD